MAKQNIGISITEDGIYEINLPYGDTLVVYLSDGVVEVQRVGKAHELKVLGDCTITKEDAIVNMSEDELWCLFHAFLARFREKEPKAFRTILDKEIHDIVLDMKKSYDG